MMQVVLDLPAVGLLRWELVKLILQLRVSLWVSFIYIFIIEISDSGQLVLHPLILAKLKTKNRYGKASCFQHDQHIHLVQHDHSREKI